MTDDLFLKIDQIIRKAPPMWIQSLGAELRSFPPTASAAFVLQKLPANGNPDLAFMFADLVKTANSRMSWESLAWSLETAANALRVWNARNSIELLWSGPSPAKQIPARRIDQVLYDLISGASREIWLVTFAAHKVDRLSKALIGALDRGVAVNLIFEFESQSMGQLSFDAISAFPDKVRQSAAIYCWPVEHRELNAAGKPGKLHAKAAVVDDAAMISSANMTDDAFSRNLELGVCISGHEVAARLRDHLRTLISHRVLQRWEH